jgi:hypothetical protein
MIHFIKIPTYTFFWIAMVKAQSDLRKSKALELEFPLAKVSQKKGGTPGGGKTQKPSWSSDVATPRPKFRMRLWPINIRRGT